MLDIGIHVDEDFDRAIATLQSLRRTATYDHVFLLLEPEVAVKSAVAPMRSTTIVRTAFAGAATAFNTLLETSTAPMVAFLESGAQVTPGALDALRAALTGSVALAGPSTNLAWNEQRHRGAPAAHDRRTLTHFARMLALRHPGEGRELTPLHSLSDFCLVVRREPVAALGGADEAYDPGPCWEMDLQIRAHRAGWRGLWMVGAYVHRAPIGALRSAREEALTLANKRRYQDRFCGRLQRGTKLEHSEHCRGDACADFAPTDLVASVIRRTPPLLSVSSATNATPLVSCILPTRDRPGFVAEAVRGFLGQDYPHRELVVVDDGAAPIAHLLPVDPRIRYLRLPETRTIGDKRNIACASARGEIIAHLDDDDWYPVHRLRRQVRALLESGASICGTSTLRFFDPVANHAWTYSCPGRRWVAGASLVYRRSVWERHPFLGVQIGEDARFLEAATDPAAIVDLRDPDLCVATVHAHNTSLKCTAGAYWQSIDIEEIGARLGARLRAYRAAASEERLVMPLVSCIMPTSNRPEFVSLAMEKFAAQDYPHKELIVVDDGPRPVSALAEGRQGVRYHRLERDDLTVGEKRNIACAMSTGEVICTWDDDDWYSPERVRCQALPIFYGEADMTGLRCDHLICLPSAEVWAVTDALHRHMFESDIAGGTITFRRDVLERARFPHINLAEDAALIRTARARGFRLKRIADHGVFAYVRHPRNTWRFEPGQYYDRNAWRRTEPPAGFSADAISAHVEACRTWLDRE
jgi:glycosyltransferase involved in cell wall biosynthesis